MTPILPGQRFGRYTIRAKLGAGGMGDVYLAEDAQLGRHVALKFLPADVETDLNAQRRLLREARSAAILDHPHICAVYEVGESDGRHYIAMQYIDGETLDARLRRNPLDVTDVLALAVQIVDGVSDAHAHGILHRDIKPANVMLTSRGDAKVMDFGLAKPAADAATAQQAETASGLTQRGHVIGTAPYMSPEQARGEVLDARSDLFSLGVLLYEMVAGRRPFQGVSTAEVAAAILTSHPAPLVRFAPATPGELDRIVTKLLQKSPDHRYQTARDLLLDLRTLKEEQAFQIRLGRTPPAAGPPHVEPLASDGASAIDSTALTERHAAAASSLRGPLTSKRFRVAPAIVAGALLAGGLGGWWTWRAVNVRRARDQVVRVAALAESNRYSEAYDLAVDAQRYLPADPTIARLMPAISDTISVTTDPSGARIYLQRFMGHGAPAAPRRLVGTSPLNELRIARGEYILSIEKDGYAPIERTLSGVMVRSSTLTIVPPPTRIVQRLMPAGSVPPRMVFVPGGEYRLIAWSRPTDRKVRLADYFIDKYEVSNQEYKEFINAGGYARREFWTYPLVNDGRVLPWEEAMRTLVDRTGLPGPRRWSNQSFPDGKADHPVTDVTWYEAQAYAAFREKRLATIFEWEKSARNGFSGAAGTAMMPWGIFYPGDPLDDRANFGSGTLPATSDAFGMSAFGVYNLAGNVAEWTANDSSDGYLATGGAWGDPTYMFSLFGGRPGFFSSEKLGFRCARTAAGGAGDQGAMRIELDAEVPVYTAPPPSTFATLASAYRYEKASLDPRVEETVQAPEWTRERITFNGANGQRAIAYLYLPNHVPRPLQVIHYIPAGDVAGGFRSLPAAMEDRIAPYVRAGRAAYGVVLDGYIERLRPPGVAAPAFGSVEYGETVVSRITDLRRGLDYLETRKDIDATRIAAVAPSAGSILGLVVGALETRYRAFIFIGAGLPASYRGIVATANPINFAGYIRAPKLILQGRYDEDTPLRTATEPFFKLLVQPKQLTLYDGGHVPSIEVTMSATSGWLDEQLGRVVR